MATDKQTMLYQAPAVLNRPDQPWFVQIEGDTIVARWKWMDATFFAPHEATVEVQQFTFAVTLTDKGTWKELDSTESKSSGIRMGGGSIGFGTSSDKFAGKKSQKSFSVGLGRDNETGQFGVIAFKFDSTMLKQPIRDYLTANGWKKAGLFG